MRPKAEVQVKWNNNIPSIDAGVGTSMDPDKWYDAYLCHDCGNIFEHYLVYIDESHLFPFGVNTENVEVRHVKSENE